MKKRIGTASILAGLACAVQGFRIHSAGWVMAGLLLFLMGLVILRRPTLDLDPVSTDSDPAGPASPGEFAYLDESGGSNDGDSSDGDAGGDADVSSCGDADVSSCDID